MLGSRSCIRPVGQAHPAHDVHLPQLHRPGPLPPLPPPVPPPPRARVDQPRPQQRSVDPRPRRHRRQPRPLGLVHQPPWAPPRMGPPPLQHRRLHRRRHLPRATHRPPGPILQTLQAGVLIPAQPRMDRLPGHLPPRRHVDDRVPIPDHRQHRLIALLHHAQLPQHRRRASSMSRNRCRPCPGPPSTVSRSHSVKHVPEPYIR
jgi:hypothetical protein